MEDGTPRLRFTLNDVVACHAIGLRLAAGDDDHAAAMAFLDRWIDASPFFEPSCAARHGRTAMAGGHPAQIVPMQLHLAREAAEARRWLGEAADGLQWLQKDDGGGVPGDRPPRGDRGRPGRHSPGAR